ncbi:cell adhesion molecule Dscam2-like [Uloborus diversus]|uniref:cell adhesion molecule Dscam2-like n=1 Tax=Uloborus diversus TaxID=327109 RepID=UPI00240A6888|nr:cell adhesion molecule Dscam2-like [Uloborus diversus]
MGLWINNRGTMFRIRYYTISSPQLGVLSVTQKHRPTRAFDESSTSLHEPPVVADFMFPSSLKEGERASAVCTIKSGDRPLEFQWLKDGTVIRESEHFKIQSVMDSSFLVIEAVSSQSSGNYTCIVKNTYGTDRFTAVLTVSSPPKWKTEPQDIHTQEGMTESVPCQAEGIPTPKIVWIHGDQIKVSEDSSRNMYLSNTGSLILSKVEASMEGPYTCEVDNGFGKPLRKTIFISVSDPPVVTSFSFPSSLKEGERASTTCTTRSGDTPLEFQWLKNGYDVQESSRLKIQTLMESSILAISSVTSESSGNYTCIVKNAFGTDRFTSTLAVTVVLNSSCYVTVLCIHIFKAPPSWKNEPDDFNTIEGESTMIHCQATGVPPPQISWFIGEDKNARITTDPQSNVRVLPNGTLAMTRITASMNGRYTCEATNDFGTPLTRTVFITVLEAPVVAPFMFPPAYKEGERASATCTIKSGDRPFEFEWKKDGHSVETSANIIIQSVLDSSMLVIQSVSAQSSGNYTCIVKNSFGNDRYTSILVVTAPPIWVKEPNDVLTQEGEALHVECLAFGVPNPTIKWLKGDTKKEVIPSDSSSVMRTSSSGTLTISRVDYTMKGLYTCEADNGFGTLLSKTINVSVRECVKEPHDVYIQEGESLSTDCSAFGVPSPDIKWRSQAPVVADFSFPSALKEGERGSATCTIRSGDRPIQFKWKKDGKDISEFNNIDIQSVKDSSILIIESVSSKSSGNYTCIVVNSFGTDKFTANLVVTAPPEWILEPEDVFTQEGEETRIDCKASGVPLPTITWTTVKYFIW